MGRRRIMQSEVNPTRICLSFVKRRRLRITLHSKSTLLYALAARLLIYLHRVS
eukprot:COSAG02_NODE_6924_length_3285_cov_1.475204_2_plen_53_part_00